MIYMNISLTYQTWWFGDILFKRHVIKGKPIPQNKGSETTHTAHTSLCSVGKWHLLNSALSPCGHNTCKLNSKFWPNLRFPVEILYNDAQIDSVGGEFNCMTTMAINQGLWKAIETKENYVCSWASCIVNYRKFSPFLPSYYHTSIETASCWSSFLQWFHSWDRHRAKQTPKHNATKAKKENETL